MAGVTAKPTLEVAVAFSSDPLDASPSWSVLDDEIVDAITTSIGREQNSDAFQPGTATVTLDNSDRSFDPFYSSGPYYGDLKPNKKVRIRATYGGTTYELFTGFVDGWPVEYEGRAAATSRVRCTDAFKLLRRAPLNADPFKQAMEAVGTPELWLRFGEKSGKQVVDSSGYGRHGTSEVDVAQHRVVSPLVGGGNTGATLKLGSQAVVSPTAWGGITGTGTFSVSFWFQGTTNPVDGCTFIVQYGDDSSWSVFIEFGRLGFVCTAGGTNTRGVYTPPSFNLLDGKPHFVVAQRVFGFAALYVDGLNWSDTLVATGSNPTLDGGTVVALDWQELVGLDWVMGEFAVWTSAVSGDAGDLYNAGVIPWDGDRTGTRIGRLLDTVPWPAGARDLDLGQSRLGPATWPADAKTLDQIRLLEQTEQGQFYVDHANAGKLRFRDRAAPFADTRSDVVQAVFSDVAADTTSVKYADIGLRYDDQLIVNIVTVKWAGGSITVEDATSKDENGPCPREIDTVIRTESEARNLAQWILDHYKDVFLRVEYLTVTMAGKSGAAATTAWPLVLGRQLGDRITVTYTPQNLGTPISLDLHIEGIKHNIGDGVKRWDVTFACTPAFAEWNYWILGTSLLDVNTVLAY